MTPQEIKQKLAEKKITQASIARRCRVSHVAVYLVIKGVAKSAKIERALARAIGVTAEELRAHKTVEAVSKFIGTYNEVA